MAWLKLGSNYLETAGTGSAAGACQHPQRQQLRHDIDNDNDNDNDNEEKDEDEEEDNVDWFCRRRMLAPAEERLTGHCGYINVSILRGTGDIYR